MLHPIRNISTMPLTRSDSASSSSSSSSTVSQNDSASSSRTAAQSDAGKSNVVLTARSVTLPDGSLNSQLFTYGIGTDTNNSLGSVYPMNLCEETIKNRFSTNSPFAGSTVKKHDVRIHLNTPNKLEPVLQIYQKPSLQIKEEMSNVLPQGLPVGEYQMAILACAVSKPQKKSALDKIQTHFSASPPLPSMKDKARGLVGLYRFDDKGQHLYLIEPKLVSPLTALEGTYLTRLLANHGGYRNRTDPATSMTLQIRPPMKQVPIDKPSGTSANPQQVAFGPYWTHPDLRGLQLSPPVTPQSTSAATTEQNNVYASLVIQPEELSEQKNTAKDIAALQTKKAQLVHEIASLL